jgi:hypothetical protein
MRYRKSQARWLKSDTERLHSDETLFAFQARFNYEAFANRFAPLMNYWPEVLSGLRQAQAFSIVVHCH